MLDTMKYLFRSAGAYAGYMTWANNTKGEEIRVKFTGHAFQTDDEVIAKTLFEKHKKECFLRGPNGDAKKFFGLSSENDVSCQMKEKSKPAKS